MVMAEEGWLGVAAEVDRDDGMRSVDDGAVRCGRAMLAAIINVKT